MPHARWLAARTLPRRSGVCDAPQRQTTVERPSIASSPRWVSASGHEEHEED